jgi:hypothetical protein
MRFHDVFSLTVELALCRTSPVHRHTYFFPQLNLHRHRVRRKLSAHVQNGFTGRAQSTSPLRLFLKTRHR